MENGNKIVWWVLGLIGTLLIAGVLGSVSTFATVKALETNVDLFRQEVQRSFAAQQHDLDVLDAKLNRHMSGGD